VHLRHDVRLQRDRLRAGDAPAAGARAPVGAAAARRLPCRARLHQPHVRRPQPALRRARPARRRRVQRLAVRLVRRSDAAPAPRQLRRRVRRAVPRARRPRLPVLLPFRRTECLDDRAAAAAGTKPGCSRLR